MHTARTSVFATCIAHAFALQRGLGSQGGTKLSKTLGNGLADCPCVGITGIDGTINVTIDGALVSYPSDVGTRCETWDDGLYPAACEKGGEPGKGSGWCAQKWCYVDPCTCEGGSPNKASLESDARYKGNSLYYSYETCGSEDTYTSWLEAQKEALHQDGHKVKRSKKKKGDESNDKEADSQAKVEDESAVGDLTVEAAPTETETSDGEAAHPEAAEATEVTSGAGEVGSGGPSTEGHSDSEPGQNGKGWTTHDTTDAARGSANAWSPPEAQDSAKAWSPPENTGNTQQGSANAWSPPEAQASAKAWSPSATTGNGQKSKSWMPSPEADTGSEKTWNKPKESTAKGKSDGWTVVKSAIAKKGASTAQKQAVKTPKEQTWKTSEASGSQDSAHGSDGWEAKDVSAAKWGKPAKNGDSQYPEKARKTWDSASSTPGASKPWKSPSAESATWHSSDDVPETKHEDEDASTPSTAPARKAGTWDTSKDGSASSSEDWTAKVAPASKHDKKADSSSKQHDSWSSPKEDDSSSKQHDSWSTPKEAAKAVEEVAPMDASGVVPKTDEAESADETESPAKKGDADEKDDEDKERKGDEPLPTKAHHTNPNFAAMCSKHHDEKKIGKGSCECIGIAKKQQGSIELSFGGDSVVFPADLGSSCSAWDKDNHPDCISNDTNTLPDWCQEAWCYVDPCSCDQKMVRADKKKGYLPKATADGKQLFYSYKTCGSVDHWTADNNDAACVNIKSEDECSGDCVWMGKSCKDQMQMDMCGTTDTLHSGGNTPCWWRALLIGAAALHCFFTF